MNLTVVLALDADRHTKPAVMQGWHTIRRSLSDIPGVTVMQADWDIARGKGPDDLLVAGYRWTVTSCQPVPVAPSIIRTARGQHPRSVVKVDADYLASWRAAKAGEVVAADDLATVRATIAGIVRAAVGPQHATSAPRVDVLEVPTGGGKTITAALTLQDVLRDAVENDRAMGRALFLLPTHDQIAELLADSRLTFLRSHSAIRYGRSPKSDEPGYCQDKAAGNGNVSGRFSENSHGVARTYCKATAIGGQCRFAEDCSRWGYLAHLQGCRDSRVVFAATAAVGMAPSELGEFSSVVVDEDITAALTAKRTVRGEHVDGWRGRVAVLDNLVASGPNPYAPGGPARAFVDILGDILAAHLPEGHVTEPLLTRFEARAIAREWDPHALLHEILGAHTRYNPDLLHWEEPEWDSRSKSWTIPMRAGVDIARALLDDISRQDPGISRVALTKKGIEIRVYRREQIDILRQKRIVNLDATPCLPKIRVLFPGAVETRLALRVYQHVTQITGNIFSRDETARAVPRLQALVEAITRRERAPLVVCHKPQNPRANRVQMPGAPPSVVFAASNPSTAWLHYGNARGTNEFETCSAVILLGCAIPNVTEMQNDFRALRAEFGATATPPASQPVEHGEDDAVAASEIRTLMPYAWTDADGNGLARYVRTSDDPDVTEHLAWSWRAEVLQAIGRARPSAEARRESPVRVYLVTGLPVDGMRIDRLVTLRELETELGVESPALPVAALATLNAERQDDLRQRVAEEVARRMETREQITVDTIMESTGARSGQRRQRVAEALAEVLMDAMCFENDVKTDLLPSIPETVLASFSTNPSGEGEGYENGGEPHQKTIPLLGGFENDANINMREVSVVLNVTGPLPTDTGIDEWEAFNLLASPPLDHASAAEWDSDGWQEVETGQTVEAATVEAFVEVELEPEPSVPPTAGDASDGFGPSGSVEPPSTPVESRGSFTAVEARTVVAVASRAQSTLSTGRQETHRLLYRAPGSCRACGQSNWFQAGPTKPRVCGTCNPRPAATTTI